MPQQVSATIRVPGEVYSQLITIAEARDCTIAESFNIYLERIKKQAVEEAQQMELKDMPKPKVKRKSKPKAHPSPEPGPEPIEPTTKSIVPEPEPWSWEPSFGFKRSKCGKCGKHILVANQASHEKVCEG